MTCNGKAIGMHSSACYASFHRVTMLIMSLDCTSTGRNDSLNYGRPASAFWAWGASEFCGSTGLYLTLLYIFGEDIPEDAHLIGIY